MEHAHRVLLGVKLERNLATNLCVRIGRIVDGRRNAGAVSAASR
jgi:hypothetical protein